jgi:TolB protein
MIRLWLRLMTGCLLLVAFLVGVATVLGRAINSDMIAFTSDRNGANHDIYLYDSLLGVVAQITDNGNNNSSPNWSPDGNTLVWLQGGSSASFYALNLNTFEEYPITNLLVSSPEMEWSPNGEAFLFEKTAANGWKNILLVNAQTREMTPLTDGDQLHESSPSWSPDGTAFTYSYQDNLAANRIAVYRLAQGERTTITDDESIYPAWSPDGSMIAYLSQRGDVPKLTLISPEGEVLTTLNFSEPLDYVQPEWSPDGMKLAFGRNTTDVLVYDLATKTLTDLTPDGVYDYDPAWSSDGTRLAVIESTDIRRQTHIVVIEVATGTRTTIGVAHANSSDRMPAWRP